MGDDQSLSRVSHRSQIEVAVSSNDAGQRTTAHRTAKCPSNRAIQHTAIVRLLRGQRVLARPKWSTGAGNARRGGLRRTRRRAAPSNPTASRRCGPRTAGPASGRRSCQRRWLSLTPAGAARAWWSALTRGCRGADDVVVVLGDLMLNSSAGRTPQYLCITHDNRSVVVGNNASAQAARFPDTSTAAAGLRAGADVELVLTGTPAGCALPSGDR